jgi:hypothetical protein
MFLSQIPSTPGVEMSAQEQKYCNKLMKEITIES